MANLTTLDDIKHLLADIRSNAKLDEGLSYRVEDAISILETGYSAFHRLPEPIEDAPAQGVEGPKDTPLKPTTGGKMQEHPIDHTFVPDSEDVSMCGECGWEKPSAIKAIAFIERMWNAKAGEFKSITEACQIIREELGGDAPWVEGRDHG